MVGQAVENLEQGESFDVQCPSCLSMTATGYTQGEIQTLTENLDSDVVNFSCTNCKTQLKYDPVSFQVTARS